MGRASCVSGAGSRPQQSLGRQAGSEAAGRLGHGGPGPPEKRGHVENRGEKTWKSGKQWLFSAQSPRRRPGGWRHRLWVVAWRKDSVDVDLVPPGAGPTQALPGAGGRGWSLPPCEVQAAGTSAPPIFLALCSQARKAPHFWASVTHPAAGCTPRVLTGARPAFSVTQHSAVNARALPCCVYPHPSPLFTAVLHPSIHQRI